MDKVLKRYRIQRWQPDEGVLLHATIIGQFVSHADHVASTEAMRKALEDCRELASGIPPCKWSDAKPEDYCENCKHTQVCRGAFQLSQAGDCGNQRPGIQSKGERT